MYDTNFYQCFHTNYINVFTYYIPVYVLNCLFSELLRGVFGQFVKKVTKKQLQVNNLHYIVHINHFSLLSLTG